jgi:hypothetical protein
MDECIKSHASCLYCDVAIMPTRVIDIGPDHSRPEPKLLSTAPGQKGRWVALSYCWGSKTDFLQTTTANIATMQNGILMEILPKTYQDAFKVMSLLGFRYICK